MGCDIHIGIQVQAPDGTWQHVPWQRSLYKHEVESGAKPLDPANGVIAPQGFDGRNYDLFGILANVRNGYGFAGTDTGDEWPSIAADRGLPDDADAEHIPEDPRYIDDGEYRDLGDHSFTWVSLDELKAFDWDGVVRAQRGIVEASKDPGVGNKPSEWCSGISGPDVVVYRSRDEYRFAAKAKMLPKSPHIKIEWNESARSATGDWAGDVIPWLESIAAGRPLRLLLGFDS